MKYLVFVRFSQIDKHYEFVGVFDTEKDAQDECTRQIGQGAIDTRIEQRELPATKGKKDAK